MGAPAALVNTHRLNPMPHCRFRHNLSFPRCDEASRTVGSTVLGFELI